MPDDVLTELGSTGLLDAYDDRPFYQRNDYLSWIDRARRPETRRKSVDQTLAELEQGGVHMGTDHPPSRKL
jgi:uncharacterized protein YdeI (YjbR/CyaY-like superfamily)